MGWELLEAVVVGALMLETEPELAIGKQGSPGEDSFWSVCPQTKTGLSAAIWALAATGTFVVD